MFLRISYTIPASLNIFVFFPGFEKNIKHLYRGVRFCELARICKIFVFFSRLWRLHRWSPPALSDRSAAAAVLPGGGILPTTTATATTGK
jgi:hypothetical protein